jgi:hypothetical protein
MCEEAPESMYHSVFGGGVSVIVLKLWARSLWSQTGGDELAGDPAVAQPVEASTVAVKACQEAAHRGRTVP